MRGWLTGGLEDSYRVYTLYIIHFIPSHFVFTFTLRLFHSFHLVMFPSLTTFVSFTLFSRLHSSLHFQFSIPSFQSHSLFLPFHPIPLPFYSTFIRSQSFSSLPYIPHWVPASQFLISSLRFTSNNIIIPQRQAHRPVLQTAVDIIILCEGGLSL